MSAKIVDSAYVEGRAPFADGGSLRQVVERVQSGSVNSEPDDLGMSFVLGFFDAAFDRLRGRTR